MRRSVFTLLVLLVLFADASGREAIERFELPGNISLIVTSPEPDYYILSLVNLNDFNLTIVENISYTFEYDIDPDSIIALDNYNKPVDSVEVKGRSVYFTYNNTLQALGYGKIFVNVLRPPPTPKPTSSPTPSPKLTNPPPPITAPPSPPEITPKPPLETAPPTPGYTEPPLENILKQINCSSPDEPSEPESMATIYIISGLIALTLFVLITQASNR